MAGQRRVGGNVTLWRATERMDRVLAETLYQRLQFNISQMVATEQTDEYRALPAAAQRKVMEELAGGVSWYKSVAERPALGLASSVGQYVRTVTST